MQACYTKGCLRGGAGRRGCPVPHLDHAAALARQFDESMQTKAEIQAHVREYMAAHHLSERQMAARLGLTQPTLGRMLDPTMTYQGMPGSWRALARYAPLGLDEATVLAAVGIASQARVSEADTWADFLRVLNRLPLTARHRAFLRYQAEMAVRDSQRPSAEDELALPNGVPPQ